MTQRYLHFGFFLLLSGCGGRESGDSPAGTGSGGDGGTVTAGTGGASGTSGTGAGGINTGTGGSRTGTGGFGQGGADYSACTPMDGCVLEPLGACGPGCEPVPISSYTAISSSQVEAYNKSRPIAPCEASACLPPPPGVATSQNYYASCESGSCEPVDVRKTALSACTSDDDCFLRGGTTCCGCGSDNLIAVSKKVNVEQVFCGPGRACAADCVSAPLPPGVVASCSAGHCAVQYPASGGGTN